MPLFSCDFAGSWAQPRRLRFLAGCLPSHTYPDKLPLPSAKRAPTSNSADGSPCAAASRNDSGPTVAAGISSGIDRETPFGVTSSCSRRPSLRWIRLPSVPSMPERLSARSPSQPHGRFRRIAPPLPDGAWPFADPIGLPDVRYLQRYRATARSSLRRARCLGTTRPSLSDGGCRFATAAGIFGRRGAFVCLIRCRLCGLSRLNGMGRRRQRSGPRRDGSIAAASERKPETGQNCDRRDCDHDETRRRPRGSVGFAVAAGGLIGLLPLFSSIFAASADFAALRACGDSIIISSGSVAARRILARRASATKSCRNFSFFR